MNAVDPVPGGDSASLNTGEMKALHDRIILFALAGILATGLVVGLATALPHYDRAKARAQEVLSHNVRVQALAISHLLSKWRDVARQVTSRTSIRDELEAYNAGDLSVETLRAFTEPKLEDALIQSVSAAGITRLDAGGGAVVRVGLALPEALLMRLRNRGGSYTEMEPVTLNGRDYVLVAAPIVNRSGDVVGTDVVSFGVAPLLAALTPQEEYGPSARLYLYRPDAERIFVAAGGDSGAVRPAADLPPVLSVRAAGGPKALPRRVADGHLAVITPVLDTAWTLAVSVPEDALQRVARDALILPLVSILVMVALGTLATGYLIRPLARRAADRAAALAATAAEQNLVLANARDFVFRRAPDGTYTYVSPAVERVTGFTQAEWLARQRRLSPVAGLPKAGEPYGTHVGFHHRRDGSRIVLEVHEHPYSEAGQVAGVVGIARDVTEAVNAEQALQRADTEWKTALDFFDDAVTVVDLDDRVLRANRAFCDMVGVHPDQIAGRDVGALIHPDCTKNECFACSARQHHIDSRLTLESEDPRNPTGQPLDVSIRVIRDGVGRPQAVLMALHDLTRSRRTEQELLLAASVFEGSHEAIVITDADRRILRANQAFLDVTRLEAPGVVGHPLSETCQVAARGAAWEAAMRTGFYQGEGSCRRAGGEVFPVWERLTVQHDARGEVLHYILAFTDITDKKHSEQRINHLAYYDVLTALPNRTLFEERLQHALERVKRQRHRLAVLLLDLDRFKNVNDSLGHRLGDDLLKGIGARLRDRVREDDTVARLGGDEFGIILEDIEGLREVEAIAAKLHAAIAEPLELGGRELFIGGSIGISLYPEDGEEAIRLLQHADAAMFRAKERGRNTYEFYTPELTVATSERLQLENDLRRAIERDELVVYYQPQVSIGAGQIIGAEALVRWQSPERGLVSPAAFIPIAEETGLIEAIGNRVLLEACSQAVAWERQGLGALRMAVNVAGYQILQGDIVGAVRQVLAETRFDPARLELEITEGFVMSRPGDGIETLNHLKAFGITLAIDDFGTGYSSLGYLKRLPIDRLKIDRSFIRDIPVDRDDMAIASTIIAMARHLGLAVIAEGVEDQSQVDFLRGQQCDEYQGFFVSPPLPATRFAQLLERVRVGAAGPA